MQHNTTRFNNHAWRIGSVEISLLILGEMCVTNGFVVKPGGYEFLYFIILSQCPS